MVDLPWTVPTAPDPGRMTAPELRAALDALGWSQKDASEQLGVCNHQRVSEWCRGLRRVPRYVAKSVLTHLALMECREEATE